MTPDTGVIVPNRLPRAGMRFKDHENHGTEHLTATGVIAKSSNIGTILVGERVPPDAMESDVPEVRRRPKTEVGFAGESSGQLAKASDWNAPQRYTVLFGQGYALTAVQAASVFATVANGGIRMPLSLVEGTVQRQRHLRASPLGAGHPGRLGTDRNPAEPDARGGHGRERHRGRRPDQGLPRRREDRYSRSLRRQARPLQRLHRVVHRLRPGREAQVCRRGVHPQAARGHVRWGPGRPGVQPGDDLPAPAGEHPVEHAVGPRVPRVGGPAVSRRTTPTC